MESSNLRASKTKRATRDINAQRREKWLDFAEHFNKTSTAAGLEFPKELSDYMAYRGGLATPSPHPRR